MFMIFKGYYSMYKKIMLLTIISLSYLYIPHAIESVDKGTHVADYSLVSSGSVHCIHYPKNISQLKDIVVNANKPIAIAGGKYSMGGQVWCQDGIMIDMRHLHAVTAFNPELKTITVQAGACWRHIQEFLHPYNLSIMVMQSYNDFSVGGSLSVNVHGRDPHGQIIQTVASIEVMLADGSLVTASRTENYDLFRAVIGGYGACGIIVSATLHLEDNYKIKRILKSMPASDFYRFYTHTIAHDKSIALFNANIYPPEFTEVVSFAWYKTDAPLTIQDMARTYTNKSDVGPSYLDKFLEYAVSNYQLAQKLRLLLDSKIGLYNNYVVWRSYEMSDSVKFLAPSTEKVSKILQEYFVPMHEFDRFMDAIRKIVVDHQVKVLNISIRHVPKNCESILSYAQKDSFAFVFYIAIDNSSDGHASTRVWTQKLIDAALHVGGTYYLPYHILALPHQIKLSYPRYPEFIAIKQKYDPSNIFQNSLTRAYQEYCL